MKTNLTELVFILDKSGSMSGLESDTIGGYNAMLKKQQEEPGEALVTTVLFDDNYVLLNDRTNIKGIRPISEKDYFVGGRTALLDAIGRTIHKIENARKQTAQEQRADKVMFVITWEFIFLGANIDAIATAARFGISANRAANYHADREGTRLNYEALSNIVSELRAGGALADSWKAEIDEDYEKRK